MSNRRLSATSPIFTLLLAGLATLSAFATDMSLPVLGDTAAAFGVTAGQAALTLSTFLIGFAFAPLVSGPVSDHMGRRPVLLFGTSLYALCGVFAARSGSLTALLVWRLLMGAGAGTGFVIVVAMVRDLFSGTEARVRQSYVNLAAGVAPVIAPTVGVIVAAFGGWRSIYGTLATGAGTLVVAAWFLLDESLPASKKDVSTYREHLVRVRASYLRVLRERLTVGFIAMATLNFGALFAYVTGSSLVLIGVLGVDKRTYGLLFACSSLGLMVGSLSNARLSRAGVPHHTLVARGMVLITATAAAMLALTYTSAPHILTIVPLAVVGFVGHGIVRPNVVQGALEPVPDVAGVTSAIMSAVQMLTGAGVSALVSTWFDGHTARSTSVAQLVCALISVVVFVRVVRPAERAAVATARPRATSPTP